MTIYGPNGGVVTGQPISPFFGAQNGASPSGGVVTTPPPAMPILEAVGRGLVPLNALVTSVNGISTGSNSNIGGDQVSVAELISNGNGEATARGTNIGANGAINQQIFVEGIATANAALSTGPTTTNTSTLTEAPVSGATLGTNVTLNAGGFVG